MDSKGKIAIVGAGHVGSHCAMALCADGVGGEIALIDCDARKAAAQALDLSDALSNLASGCSVRPGTYDDCADADIVVIAIGKPWIPGQGRLDLLDSSIQMLDGLLAALKPIAPRGIVITITNPADIVADYVRRGLDLPRSRAFGTGTLLDSARLVRILSELTGVERSDIAAAVLGEHGDSAMIPFSQVRIAGKPIDDFGGLDRETILRRTRRAGMDIIEDKGSTEFGIAQALSTLCSAILGDEKRILQVSAALEGEFGQREVSCGVPCVIGRGGIEAIVEPNLPAEELALLATSCDIIRRHMTIVNGLSNRC
jgi:L-lactate dehydrogenase